MKHITKMIDRKQIDTEIQIVFGTPTASQISGEMKKFSTEPRRETHKVAPKAIASSFPLK